jgi:epoxyqueuosine reductase
MLTEASIRTLALGLGFDACGTAPACRLDADARFMDGWVDSGCAGDMTYLQRNRELRYDIRSLVPGAKTVVVCLLSYDKSGHDYHRRVKSLLYALHGAIEDYCRGVGEPVGELFNSEVQHVFCDSAPVLERRWAVKAGLGFIGRNHQLISPQFGSMVHLGELVLNTEVEPDGESPVLPEGCGACRRCVEACPGQALGREEWDARRCIAYVTHRCMVCQQCCPYNENFL